MAEQPSSVKNDCSRDASISCYLLAFHYHELELLKIEVIKENILKAFQAKLPEGYWGVGLLYREGLCGFEINEDKALEFFQKAAFLDHFDAKIHLALSLFSKNR